VIILNEMKIVSLMFHVDRHDSKCAFVVAAFAQRCPNGRLIALFSTKLVFLFVPITGDEISVVENNSFKDDNTL
jgi:hypothetical protein